jgi:3-deoxy-manno-octulosonate cytidylyltransferase (CMP-KDO synthetase)
MTFTVVIPARYASTRLPAKPLLDIGGKPMIQHVWERACQSKAQQIIIATDNERIFNAAKSFGAEVVMTIEDHPSGTDRLQEVASQYGFNDSQIIVNVQGDEPLIPPAVINQVAENLQRNTAAGIATLSEFITDVDQLFDPNAVKVVSDLQGFALYFSRAPIPWDRDNFQPGKKPVLQPGAWSRHIGIYAYRVGFLHQFIQWPVGHLEKIEKLEQLRAMENGVRIHVANTCENIPAGVDTEEDLERVRNLILA